MSERLATALDDLRRRWVPDPRLGVFEISLAADGRLTGASTSRPAVDAVRRLAADAERRSTITVLPDASIGAGTAAIVTAGAAPLVVEPRAGASRASEALHGERLRVLERRGAWLRVRAADGYHAWVHEGYLATGSDEWAEDWGARATAWSLGAELRFDDGRLRIPLGARVAVRHRGRVEAADGRIGRISAGVIRSGLEAGAEARLVAAPEWALRWLGGAPYAWGGRCEWGIDCSGFVQTTYALRGAPLPRDADLQFGEGHNVPLAADGAGYCAGDLVFFADNGRVAHVALWAGAGTVVHATLDRGGVATDDLFRDDPPGRRLRASLVGVKRLGS